MSDDPIVRRLDRLAIASRVPALLDAMVRPDWRGRHYLTAFVLAQAVVIAWLLLG